MDNRPLGSRWLSEAKELISEDEYKRLEQLVREDGFTADHYTYDAACTLRDEIEEQKAPR